jgi:hypothetical protein
MLPGGREAISGKLNFSCPNTASFQTAVHFGVRQFTKYLEMKFLKQGSLFYGFNSLIYQL